MFTCIYATAFGYYFVLDNRQGETAGLALLLFFAVALLALLAICLQAKVLLKWREDLMDRNSGLKALLAILGLLAPFAAHAVTVGDLVPYRAVYELQLENVSEKASITGISGRMVYEFNGSRCEGYTTQFRSAVRFDVEGEASRLVDYQTTSFEAANGGEFHFASKNYTDDKLIKEITGVARKKNAIINIRLSKPAETEYHLKAASFPMMYTLQMLENAQAGKHFMRVRLYDGSEDADALIETAAVIGKEKKPEPDNETKVMGALGSETVWPVVVSYYNDSENNDGLPSYRTSFLLYKNGITRDLFMDYGDFSVRGKLVNLELLKHKKDREDSCPH